MTSHTYCVDFRERSVSELVLGELAHLTERHYVERLTDRATPVVVQPEQLASVANEIIVVLHAGLPNTTESQYTQSLLRHGKRVYYYWPGENAIEVITRERLKSLQRHRRVVHLFDWWKRRAERRLQPHPVSASPATEPAAPATEPAASAAANRELPPLRPRLSRTEAESFLAQEDGTYRVQGRGMYVRLDYWAKLKGGGSYGHTCYQAKALDKSCRDGLVCVTASPFALLDQFGIEQIVLQSQTPLADEFALVDNGIAYESAIEELIRVRQPKFVFERAVLGNRAVSRACRRLGVPHIVEFNGSELTMSKIFGGREMNNSAMLQWIETASFREADLICTVSDPVKDMVTELGIPADKILVNPNGVDLDAYGPLPAAERHTLRTSLGLAEEDVVVGFCGTFGGWHGIEVLAEAMPQICAARSSVKFLLIGDGNFKHLVKDAIEQHSLQNRVKDVGMVPQQEAARLLAACDVLLSPHSKNMGDKPFFGSPTKLFEYMAYGAGIVCSDLVQLGEVMRPALSLPDRHSGRPVGKARAVLVEPASVSDLVAATLWLVDDPALCAALGRNAQAAAAAYYSWDIHVQSLWRFACNEAPIGYHEDRQIL